MKKNRKYVALFYLTVGTPFVLFCAQVLFYLMISIVIMAIEQSDLKFFIEFIKEYIYTIFKLSCFVGILSGAIIWYAECRRYGIKIFGK
ncbi:MULTISPECIES: hypothetical protein [unclassified Gilliamella]|uniref:hypothetical protein n=1 Tax=unclassified Gilliamella TaxID=2685620 RepID=UPI00080EA24A|nr:MULTISPECIES: hypothetical protein [Gilliamella]MWN32945.1 hypothetical protein [Gilliamella sp. Pra-s60]MWP30393.1 hypothetical protein [Gilliamella sp. Pra-s54]NUF28299.1 hypothetical protein [Gilliamella sp. ESL0254]OCG40380.1 hypothetical protein A9G25_00340 [Gilliamella apicola]